MVLEPERLKYLKDYEFLLAQEYVTYRNKKEKLFRIDTINHVGRNFMVLIIDYKEAINLRNILNDFIREVESEVSYI